MAERDLKAEIEDTERVFAALAHDSRRHILLTLKFRGGAMTAGEIADRFGCSWPTTTRHLRTLLDAGLVSVEKQGRERVYRLEASRLRRVVADWMRWFGEAPKKSRRAETGPPRKSAPKG